MAKARGFTPWFDNYPDRSLEIMYHYFESVPSNIDTPTAYAVGFLANLFVIFAFLYLSLLQKYLDWLAKRRF